MDKVLSGKVVLITGGGQGIGRECALGYARAGASVSVLDLNLDTAQETVAQLEDGRGLALRCNVTNSMEVRDAVDATLQKFGRLDVVHNNAGLASPSKPLHETSEKEWDALFNVNLKSVYLTTLHSIEALKASRGCILNTASMVGLLGQENHAAYVATKGAMVSLTKSMALDYAPFGIRVNAICPAAVWTPLLRVWVKEQPDPAVTEDFLNHIHILGYCPEGDVVADAAVFLVSEQARFVTGISLPVSGGAELGYRRFH